MKSTLHTPNSAPQAAGTIEFWPLEKSDGIQYYSMGIKEIDNYLRIAENQKEAIELATSLLNGKRTLAQIRNIMRKKHNIELDVPALYDTLYNAGFIKGGPAAPRNNSEVKILGIPLFRYTFQNRPFTAALIQKFWKPALFLMIASILSGVYFFLFSMLTPDASGETHLFNRIYAMNGSFLFGLLISLLASPLFLLLHELGHFTAAVRHNLKPDYFAISLYMGIFFMWYVKIPGMYTIRKRARIQILLAGGFVNLFLFSSIVNIIYFIPVSLVWEELLWKMALANIYSFLFTLLPFSLSDGYFLMTTIAGKSNLRLKLIKEIKNFSQNRNLSGFTPSMTTYLFVCLAFIGVSVPASYLWLAELTNEVFTFLSITNPLLIKAVSVALLSVMLFTPFVFSFKRIISIRE